MRVLVADDDVTSRSILGAVLRKWGHVPVVVEDGLAAWEVLQLPDAPRLVVLDWSMPGIDGLEVCRRLRALPSREPAYVVLLTARGEKGEIVEGLEAGANDFVVKPFDSGELRARLAVGERVIELQRALNERIRDLSAALEHVRTLQGLIPICMHCHRIRDDSETWQRIERYFEAHSEAHFTHSLCPECLERVYPDS
jgi:DNA-binding response OmpR family regulator